MARRIVEHPRGSGLFAVTGADGSLPPSTSPPPAEPLDPERLESIRMMLNSASHARQASHNERREPYASAYYSDVSYLLEHLPSGEMPTELSRPSEPIDETDPRRPVTVGELVTALQTYPQDALVHTWEAGTGCGGIGVDLPDEGLTEVWDGTSSASRWHNHDKVPFEACRPQTMQEATRIEVYCKRCRETYHAPNEADAQVWATAHEEGHLERDAAKLNRKTRGRKRA